MVLISLVGCLPFGMGDPEKSTADNKLVGLWLSEAKDDDQVLWMVLPYDARTLLVTQYVFKRNGDAIEPGERANSKAWLTPIGGRQFITLEVKGGGELFKADEKTFMSAQIELTGDKAIVRGINADYVKKNNVDSAEKLTKFVAGHIDDAELYIDQ